MVFTLIGYNGHLKSGWSQISQEKISMTSNSQRMDS